MLWQPGTPVVARPSHLGHRPDTSPSLMKDMVRPVIKETSNVKTQFARISLLLGALVATASVSGCKKTDAPKGEATGGASGGLITGVALNGSGSTFMKAFQEISIEAFVKVNPTIKINYGGGGSGKGRQDLADQVVDFAGSDAPYKDADLAKNKGGEVLYFPVVLGAVTVSYNLDDVDKLKLSPDTIAKIFQREIKKWDDAAIAAENPGVKLPSLDIVVAHRSDGSGTTDIFTRFLDGAAPGVWKLKYGSTVEWSADTQAGQGNAGVSQIVKSTKGAIGYVDLSDAKASGQKYASVKNQAGVYVEPNSASVSAAGAGVEVKDNLTFSSVNSKSEAAYPISGQAWVIVYAKQTDKAKAEALKAYLKYMLTDGQAALEEIDFAPLPKDLQERALAQLDKLQIP
jgi:phosphate transport system substrate-binding protein